LCSDSPREQLAFEAMLALENPEHHLRAMEIRRIYRKARDFLDSIYFGGLMLDLKHLTKHQNTSS
jgi:kinetochore protein Nuf2